ncbi:acetolactate synthase AlsS [Candidiatus Paracoxiella cheracis]|uniref:acetolactate synthase AlsS n=1 Tax=Candidiatus Paracoxiella cheracis TaxID=3405120 RepID=UPI003BF4C2AD
MAAKSSGAKLLVNCLINHGVEYIFGIPGAKVDAIFNALVDVRDKIKLIVCRHEQNAAFMAGIYGRLTGKPGVVLVTSGPGVSNLATGLLTATTEGDPIVAMGANVPRAMRLKESHQSTDNVALMTPVTKHSSEVVLAENIPEVVENAFRIATTPHCGAVFMSLPQDVLTCETKAFATKAVPPVEYGSAPETKIKQAAALINHAKQPVFFLGLEASKPKNTEAIRALLKKTPMPVVSTYQAAGVISRDLVKYFVGRLGLFKNQPGDKLLDVADVVVTVGYNPVEYDPETWNRKCNKTIIDIDTNPANIHTTYQPKIELVGDIAKNLNALSTHLEKRDTLAHEKFVKKLQQELQDKIASGAKFNGKLIHPLRVIHDLNQCSDDTTTIISDVGTHYMWLARYLFSYEPHHLLFSNGQQTLGVALPWAIATTLVRPHKKVISISGDGGFLFSAMELETAVRENCHFVHCVWVDGSYDMVAEQELMKYKRTSGVDFGPVNIVDYAKSFGAKGYAVNHSDALLETLQEALNDEGPVLIQIPIDYSDNLELFKSACDNLGH